MLIKHLKCLFRKIKKYDPDKRENPQYRLEKAKITFRSIEKTINSINRNINYDLQLESCKIMIKQFKLNFSKQVSLLSLLEDTLKQKETELSNINLN